MNGRLSPSRWEGAVPTTVSMVVAPQTAIRIANGFEIPGAAGSEKETWGTSAGFQADFFRRLTP
jgi:hypothetical protein